MSAPTVYVTHGRKYHVRADCPRMVYGENLHDWEGETDWGYDGFTAGTYRREDPSPQDAAARGKLPCLHCVPAELRLFPPLYGQDFGHRPIVSFIDGRALNRVCARCTTNTPTGVWGVRWPCTSAIVLGLVDRPPGGGQ
ncbi:hypothetical protein ACFVY4_27005 [Streptomyces sp. NPDC058299]|uniref:hypothetical protein n=1 Tax=Streptomyces sp. NPDC058299 TaxID=3346435 RepID=UPI0036EF12AC